MPYRSQEQERNLKLLRGSLKPVGVVDIIVHPEPEGGAGEDPRRIVGT